MDLVIIGSHRFKPKLDSDQSHNSQICVHGTDWISSEDKEIVFNVLDRVFKSSEVPCPNFSCWMVGAVTLMSRGATMSVPDLHGLVC